MLRNFKHIGGGGGFGGLSLEYQIVRDYPILFV